MTKNEMGFDRRVVLERTLGLTALFGGIALLDVDAVAAQSGGATMPGFDMKPGVRRIITGHNEKGRSVHHQGRPHHHRRVSELVKATGDQPLGPGPSGEPQKILPTDAPQLEPSLGGSSFHFVTLPPTPRGAKPGWHRTMTLRLQHPAGRGAGADGRRRRNDAPPRRRGDTAQHATRVAERHQDAGLLGRGTGPDQPAGVIDGGSRARPTAGVSSSPRA